MIIKVDVRENKLIQLLKKLLTEKFTKYDILIKEEQLDIGDIIIIHNDSKLIIERKSINDLASSISDGRYMEQSYRLDKVDIHNHNIMYLIEGDSGNSEKNENENTQEYVDVICNSKKSNITKDNIGIILLSQIPSVSKSIAKSLMNEYKTLRDLINEIEKNNDVLKNCKIKDTNGKERKISKTAIENIKEYLVFNKCL